MSSTKRKIVSAKETWMETWDLIAQMRSKKDAPVDTMGCERLAQKHKNQDERDFRFQTLVSLMLSSQTKDQVTAEAFDRLSLACPEGRITVQAISHLDPKVLNEAICKVGFHRRKTEYLRKTANLLQEKYNGDIPASVTELVTLPGVGSKMAYLAMNCAWNERAGIGVDVHVHRISGRLGWTEPKESKSPEDTRMALEKLLPKSHWIEVNPLLVGFGQTVCLPRNPLCDQCLLNESCPSAFRGASSSSSKKTKAK